MQRQAISPTSAIQRGGFEIVGVRTDVQNGIVIGNKPGVKYHLPLPKHPERLFCGVESYSRGLLAAFQGVPTLKNDIQSFALTLFDVEGREIVRDMPLIRIWPVNDTSGHGFFQRTLFFEPVRIDFLQSYVVNFNPSSAADGVIPIAFIYP